MVSTFSQIGIAPDDVATAPIEFGEWLPDLPDLNNPGALEALNVIPTGGGYAPFADLEVDVDMGLPNPVRGGIQVFDKQGSPHIYVGTGAGLYKSQSGAFSQRYVPSITLFDEFLWGFSQFGDSLVAFHPQVAPLVADVGGLPAFTPLGGSPPIARCGTRVGNFLVLGNLDGEPLPDDARQPSRIRWSGYNNIEAPWTTNPSTQADFNDMPAEGGDVIAITGRENGTVFQERAISRMTYAGLPTVFDINTVEGRRGALCTGGVIDLGALVFFPATDGFFVWNQVEAQPIGDNKVSAYFFKRLNYAMRHRIVGAVDYINKCIMWAFPTGDGTILDEVLIYSLKENKFSHAVLDLEYMIPSATFDTEIEAFAPTLESYMLSFDSSIYTGRRPYLAGFNTSHQYGRFNGPNLQATIDTGEYTGANGRRVFINSVRPIVNVAEPVVTVQLLMRDQMIGEAITYSPVTAQEITGECPVMGDARYMRMRMSIPAGMTWTHAQGVDTWRKATGRV